MCGRYAVFTPPKKLKDLFGTDNLPNFPARYNAAPLQDMPVIVRGRMGMARWGLLPPWLSADDRGMAAKMINARSETVSEKPAFREAWQKGRRCLIPADGFYEWKKDEESGVNQPYYIAAKDRECMAFAGLWSKVADIITFTILTKDADGPIAALHHRMPVILKPSQAASWFAASPDEGAEMMRAAAGRDLQFHPVSRLVGNVANDEPGLTNPLPASEAGSAGQSNIKEDRASQGALF